MASRLDHIAHPTPLEASARTGFAGNRLDRVSERRDEAGFIADLCARPDAHYVLFYEDRALLKVESGALTPLFAAEDALRFAPAMEEAALLGLDEGVPVFATRIERPPDLDQHDPDHQLIDLRSLAMQAVLSQHELGVLAQGRSLVNWHERHGYCSNCGVRTAIAQAGYRRDCPACDAHHFPRTDPVVIMLAIDGERCLLGRQHRFQAGMYSCLAGFVEPGETLEDAVRREVKEEAGLLVGRVVYHASQPWPFPSTLMIGCFAEALTTTIVREEAELEDARWFARDELAAMLERRHAGGLFTPPQMAIAHHLIRAYADGQALLSGQS